jgi:glycosyltransferase involved in cell wall biosynthesis
MRIKSDKILSGREIIIGPRYYQAVKEMNVTVYIGIYNGVPYLQSLKEQLQIQTSQNYPLILVDNFSTDESWLHLKNWPVELRDRAKLVRNPLNLGATGSFSLNFPEIQTDWFVTLHQDDTYESNHLSVLTQSIKSSGPKEIVVFTDMGAQSLEGKKLYTPIRQSWVANLETPQSAFRANLIQQSVSYPSAAFRASGLSPIRIPWHSSSFPDTEVTLLQASQGSFRFVPELTMLYRMNPKSESHDLNPKERVLGPFASLNRVMASDSFLSLCLDVPEKERESFSKAVLEGIDIRLGASPFSEMVKLVAAETMGLAWDYTEKNSREQILATYKMAEAGRTTKLLEELGAFYAEGNSTQTVTQSHPLSKAQIELEKLLNAATPPSNAQAGGVQRAALTLIGMFFPLPIRRKVVSFVARIYARLNPESPWNLSWKPKN